MYNIYIKNNDDKIYYPIVIAMENNITIVLDKHHQCPHLLSLNNPCGIQLQNELNNNVWDTNCCNVRVSPWKSHLSKIGASILGTSKTSHLKLMHIIRDLTTFLF